MYSYHLYLLCGHVVHPYLCVDIFLSLMCQSILLLGDFPPVLAALLKLDAKYENMRIPD